MRKPLIITALILLAAGAVAYWRSCTPGPSHKEEKKNLDTLSTAYTNAVAEKQRQIIGLELQRDSLQKKLDSSTLLLSFVRKDAASRIDAVRRTLSGAAAAAARHDTAAILINWDSLRAQVISGLPVVIAQDSLSQQVIADCLQQGMVKDSLIYNYRNLWQKSDTLRQHYALAYNGLYVDYGRLNKQFKFNKTLSRAEAVVILAALAKIFIFK